MRGASEEVAAAADALVTYATTVLPLARQELRRHEVAAAEKVANVEAVSVLAVTAPPRAREVVVRAIAALQIAIDRLDVLEEEGRGAPLGSREREQLALLEDEWRRAVAALPAAGALLPRIEAAAERCAAGQRQTHTAAQGDREALRQWAEGLGLRPGYRWWEAAAGASSSVAAHALIAAAADPRTDTAAATAIGAAYYPSIGALTVLLDDLVDRDADLAAGEHNYLTYYRDAEEAAERIAAIGREAASAVRALPHRRRHAAILAGVAAFYLSAPEAQSAYAAPIRQRLLAALGPGTKPLAAFMRLRRLA